MCIVLYHGTWYTLPCYCYLSHYPGLSWIILILINPVLVDAGCRMHILIVPWTLDPGPWTLDPGPWTASCILHLLYNRYLYLSIYVCMHTPCAIRHTQLHLFHFSEVNPFQHIFQLLSNSVTFAVFLSCFDLWLYFYDNHLNFIF